MEVEWVITLASTSGAILAEQALLAAGLEPRVMPLPSCIRAGCGLCLRLLPENKDQALAVLGQQGIAWEGLYVRSVGAKSRYQEVAL